jgi:hypothetical protein
LNPSDTPPKRNPVRRRVNMAFLAVGFLVCVWIYRDLRPERHLLPSGQTAQIISITDGLRRPHPGPTIPLIFELTNRLGLSAIRASYHPFPSPQDASQLVVYMKILDVPPPPASGGNQADHNRFRCLIDPVPLAPPQAGRRSIDSSVMVAHDPDGLWFAPIKNFYYYYDRYGAHIKIVSEPPPPSVQKIRYVLLDEVVPEPWSLTKDPLPNRPVLWSMTVKSPRAKWGRSPSNRQLAPPLPQTEVGQHTSVTLTGVYYPILSQHFYDRPIPWTPPGSEVGWAVPPGLGLELQVMPLDPSPRRFPARLTDISAIDAKGHEHRKGFGFLPLRSLGNFKATLLLPPLDGLPAQTRVTVALPFDAPHAEYRTTFTVTKPANPSHSPVLTPQPTSVSLALGNHGIDFFPVLGTNSPSHVLEYTTDIHPDILNDYHMEATATFTVNGRSTDLSFHHLNEPSGPSGRSRIVGITLGDYNALVGLRNSTSTTGTLAVSIRVLRQESHLLTLNR